jgi:indolin-2-one monooxygenase/3-hydroxyindolin-2-one monooxygenase/benzoxazinone N-monooxygenase
MFEAGIETSYLTLEYGMAELMNNRHIMTKLQKEVRMCKSEGDMISEEDLASMPYLKATIKETLRLHPPAPFLLPHFSTADCEVDGYLIPSETRVLVNAWALGRDPSSWERPEEFMPERFLQEAGAADTQMKGKDLRFLPFGFGRRICPGMNFGFATMEIMLANLMYHFDWDVPNKPRDAGVDMAESFGLTLRRIEKLVLVPRIA